ncbi:hypothetical protein Tco_0007345 [Tanacetum coccineum]
MGSMIGPYFPGSMSKVQGVRFRGSRSEFSEEGLVTGVSDQSRGSVLGGSVLGSVLVVQTYIMMWVQVKMDDPNITMEEYIRLEEEKAHRHSKVYNWETTTYGKIWYDEDVQDLRSVETEFPAIVLNDALTSKVTLSCEFPAIVYNDALTSKLYFLTERAMSPQHIDELDLKDETSLFECDEEEQNVLYFNDLFPLNIIYSDDSKSDKDNDDHEIDIKQSLRGNVINTDDGAYAQRSNKLLETSHDTSKKNFKTETFIKELNVNIMTWNHLNKGMSSIFLIKNLYVPFGILFDPKLFYKDGVKLGQV